jgi:predicted enzyme related to lactoylglutathione lyase
MEVLSSRTIIVTEDFARSRAFYEDTLGLSVYREYGSGGAVTGVVFFLDGGFLELTPGSALRTGDAIKLWLQVADLAAEEHRLGQSGVTVKKPAGRMTWGKCGSRIPTASNFDSSKSLPTTPFGVGSTDARLATPSRGTGNRATPAETAAPGGQASVRD